MGVGDLLGFGALVLEMNLPHGGLEACACYHPHDECTAACACPVLPAAAVELEAAVPSKRGKV